MEIIQDFIFVYWLKLEYKEYPRENQDHKSPIPYDGLLDAMIEHHGYGRKCLMERINLLYEMKPGFIEYSKIDDKTFIRVGYN